MCKNKAKRNNPLCQCLLPTLVTLKRFGLATSNFPQVKYVKWAFLYNCVCIIPITGFEMLRLWNLSRLIWHTLYLRFITYMWCKHLIVTLPNIHNHFGFRDSSAKHFFSYHKNQSHNFKWMQPNGSLLTVNPSVMEHEQRWIDKVMVTEIEWSRESE